jgi:trehalose 6-phosphate phosphatase
MHWTSATDTLLNTWLDHTRLGLVCDVDGTLSDIVDQPDAATVSPRHRDLLRQLGQRLPLVAFVSGRAVTDVRRMVDLPELVYVGNHGLEWWIDGQVQLSPEAAQYRPALKAAMAALEAHMVSGMMIEDKGATLSIHYRQTADPAATADALRPILEQIAAAHHIALFQGRMIYELRPPIDVNKGTAFRELVTRHTLDAALYLGDDTTDVDALRMAHELREAGTCYTLGLGVTADETPAAVLATADLLVSGVQDVASFLDWLLSALSASST